MFSRLFFLQEHWIITQTGARKTRKSFIPLLSDGDRGQDLGTITQVEGFSLSRHTEVFFFLLSKNSVRGQKASVTPFQWRYFFSRP